MTAAIAAGRRLFPRGYADFGYQLLIWFGFLAAYQVARGVADRDPSRAFANGWRVIDVEQRLAGLGELTLQGEKDAPAGMGEDRAIDDQPNSLHAFGGAEEVLRLGDQRRVHAHAPCWRGGRSSRASIVPKR